MELGVHDGATPVLPRHWYESFSSTWRSMASVLGLKKLQELIQGTYPLSDQPAWLLGTWYGLRDHDAEQDTLPSEMEAALLADFGCRLWFTYRKSFPPLGPAGLTSDAGWGCTLRTGQMMLAEALLRDRLGRQTCRPAAGAGRQALCEVLQLFLDHPAPQHPFSIHNICRYGAPHGVVPGQWLGPWVLCKALEAAVAAAGPGIGLRLHVVCDPGGGAPQLQVARLEALFSQPELTAAAAAGSRGGTGEHSAEQQQQQQQQEVVQQYDQRQQFEALADAAGCIRAGSSSQCHETDGPGAAHCSSRQPEAICHGPGAVSTAAAAAPLAEGQGACTAPQSGLLLLVPLTLGVGKVNERYLPQLQAVLSFPQTVGIVGGRPGASLYFVGYQGGCIMYLDPHDTQEVAELPQDLESYFCCSPRLMALSAIDPSLAIGFYCQTLGDVQDLGRRLQDMAAAAGTAPILTLDWGRGEAAELKDYAPGGADRAGMAAANGAGLPEEPSVQQEGDLDRAPSSGDEWQLV